MNDARKTILLVDDHVLLLEYRESRLVLEFGEGAVTTATSATTALVAARMIRPSVIVSDIYMERRDAGYALCRELLNDPDLASVPVILYTAGDLTEDQAALARSLHVAAVFERTSMDLGPLVEKIRELLAKA